jgi:hypothetical protein
VNANCSEAAHSKLRSENTWLEIHGQSLSHLEEMIRRSGSERLLFGTDWPFYHTAVQLAKILIATDGDDVMRHLILRGNAETLLGLTPTNTRNQAMELWELIARESIRDLVARYNANGDSGRFDAMLELFAEQAVMELPGATHRGKSEIRAMFEGVSAGTGSGEGARARFIRHFTATHQIDLLDEVQARGRSYYVVFTDRGVDHWGRYVDEYRSIEGRWLFWHRKVSLDARVPDGWSGGAES